MDNLFQSALPRHNPHWEKGVYTGLFQRSILPVLMKQLPLREVMVLLGIRRSGKSTLFRLLINELLSQGMNPKTILHVNLEDPFFQPVWRDAKSLYHVIEASETLTGWPVMYLLLDEIQGVEGWEYFVKSAYDTERVKKIFVTASNSSLLQQEYASLLTGRHLETLVYPLSFQERLEVEGLGTPLARAQAPVRVKQLVEEALQFGGFPAIVQMPDIETKALLLEQYYNDILLKDCVSRHEIRDIKTFKHLAHYVMTNSACEMGYTQLAAALNSTDMTVKQHLAIVEDSYLVQEIREFHYSLQKQYKGKRKFYVIDNGLLAVMNPHFTQNWGKKLENLVFTELKKQGAQAIYFYQKTNECDFIVEYKDGKRLALQVCYQFDPALHLRETKGLNTAIKECQCDEGLIVTYDQALKLDNGVNVIPFWQFAAHDG